MHTHWTNDHRKWYRTVYLKSEHWRDLRGRKLNRNPQCERCQAKACDVHHVRYRNIFDVQLHDLLSLCRACHTEEHRVNGMPKRRKVIDRSFTPMQRAGLALQRRKQKIRRLESILNQKGVRNDPYRRNLILAKIAKIKAKLVCV